MKIYTELKDLIGIKQRNEWDIPPMTKVIPDKRKKKKETYKRDDYYDDCDDW